MGAAPRRTEEGLQPTAQGEKHLLWSQCVGSEPASGTYRLDQHKALGLGLLSLKWGQDSIFLTECSVISACNRLINTHHNL